jgi:polar amino acid transport system permease protein
MAASSLPVWLLLAPRDYLSTFVKLGVVLLLLVFFAAQFAGLEAPLAAIAIAAVAIRMSALAAENVRAGLDSVRPTQWEAALTMNIAPWTVLGRIVLPQAWRVILPPSIVHVLSMVKETSLVSQIGFIEPARSSRMRLVTAS